MTGRRQITRAQTDYFAGVPVGVTIRGDVVRGRVITGATALLLAQVTS